MSDGRFEFPAPRPWRLEGEAIRDREGGVVMSALNPANMETRSLIVRAVNERETIINAHVILSGEVHELAAEADRMAEFVRKLCDMVADHPIWRPSETEQWLIAEARKAIGGDAR